MTEQHRATPEQWADQEIWAASSGDSSCILELRARVEALEAAQRPRVFTAEEVAPIVVPTTPSPAGSLVERVGVRIFFGINANQDAEGIALAVLRDIAAWLRDQHDSDQIVHTAWEAAKWLEQEAAR
jgi:hypothetical protein